MKIIPLVALILLPFSTIAAQDPDHDEHEGANDPISLIKNELTNRLLVLEKKLSRATQLQILGEVRVHVQSLKGDDRDAATFDVAKAYLRFRFTDEAKILFTNVANNAATNEYKVSALEMLGDIAYVREGNIEQAVEMTEQALLLAQTSKQNEKAAELLIKTGSWYFIQDDVPKMKNCYQEFLTLPEDIRVQFPRESLKANLYLGRAFKEEGSHELSQEYFVKVMGLLKKNPDLFEPNLILGLALEEESAVWNSPKRIERLLKLYKTEKYKLEPALLDVGNHIFWAFFLERSKEKEFLDRFVEFAKLHMKNASCFKERQDEIGEIDFESITQVASQTIAAYSFVCSENKLRFDKADLAKQLKEWMENSPRMTGKFPNGISRDNLNKCANSIRRGVVEVLELNPESNRAEDDDTEIAREPTPATKDSKLDGSKEG